MDDKVFGREYALTTSIFLVDPCSHLNSKSEKYGRTSVYAEFINT